MPDDVLRGIDAPRPLPAHVRSALEERLLGADEELVGLLRSAEAPRELSAAHRDELRRQLTRRRGLPRWMVGAAAAVTLVAGALIALPPGTTVAPTAQRPPAGAGMAGETYDGAASGGSEAVQESPAAAVPGAPAPVASPQPSPRPPAAGSPAPANPGSGAAGGSSGGQPAAAGPPRGVSGVAPEEGRVAGGTRITLSGNDLSRAVRVDLNGRAGADLVVESDTRISVVTPAAAEPGPATIEVHLSTGEVYLVPAAFTYLAAPTVTAVDPPEGPATGGNVVLVTGRDFSERVTVRFGDTRANDVRVVSDTELRVVAPAHLPGRVNLTVTTAGGTSNSVDYVYGA